MLKTPRASASRSASRSDSRLNRRSVIGASAVASFAALVSAGGCDSQGTVSSTDALSTAGSGNSAGAAKAGAAGSTGIIGNGGSFATGGSTTATSGGSGGALSNGGGGTGPVAAAGGSGGSGGAVAGSGGTSGGGSTSTGGKPCMDVEPPPDPDWPDATCAKWAAETTECTASWFASYCDVSCGRCVPTGAGGQGSGGASNGGSGGAGGKPCMDVEPPPDPKWPGATCAEWATETTECQASWFANYCDVSCGRCVPEGGSAGAGNAGAPAVDCSSEPQVTGGNGYATRYWDCCQTHCSQFNGHRCGQDGTSSTGNTQSACNGGGSFACYDEAPRAVSDCLSYGHIAKSNPNCGGCYRIQFTGEGQHNANDPGSKAIKGKQMIVKVTNTGGDVAGNQFDLMIPGGGVGMFNACSRQWNQNDLGAQYGGFLTECNGSHQQKKDCVRAECMKIPAGKARDGCLWFVDWFQVADNPKFTSQSTNCPF